MSPWRQSDKWGGVYAWWEGFLEKISVELEWKIRKSRLLLRTNDVIEKYKSHDAPGMHHSNIFNSAVTT